MFGVSTAERFVRSWYQKYPRPRTRKFRPPRMLAYTHHEFHWGQHGMLSRELEFFNGENYLEWHSRRGTASARHRVDTGLHRERDLSVIVGRQVLSVSDAKSNIEVRLPLKKTCVPFAS
jgi:hypothetical protein